MWQKFLISGTIHSHSHSHLILDPGSAYYDDAGGRFAPSSVIGVGRSRIQDQVAVAVAVAVAGLTKRFFNHIQKDFLINVWGYIKIKRNFFRGEEVPLEVLKLCLVSKFFLGGTHSHSHSHLILDPGSAYYDDAGGGFAPSSVIGVGRSRIQDQVAVAVGGGGALAVAVAGLTKRFFNHIQKIS